MQVLLRRSLKYGDAPGVSVRFALWVKFELTEDETQLLNRRSNAALGYLTIEGSRRDFYRAAIISFFISLAAVVLLSVSMASSYNPQTGRPFEVPTEMYLLLFVGVFALATWIIYEQLREAIKIGDMLIGREFKHKSLVLMARRERQAIGYGVVFQQFLEKLRDWEGTDVVTLTEEHESAKLLVTDVYAPA